MAEGTAHSLPPAEDASGQFLLDLDGFEGPIDLLLSLARDSKLDLSRISILALAEQYLAFIDRARRGRLDLAADYLVMAAWLAYLKSRLLLPPEEADEEDDPGPSPVEMAEALAWQVRRLEAMQQAAADLFARPMLGRDVFARAPSPADAPPLADAPVELIADLTQLLQAYAGIRQREADRTYAIRPPELIGVDEALADLRAALTRLPPGEWTTLNALLPASPPQALAIQTRATLACTFVAALTLAKEQAIALEQPAPFAPIRLQVLEGRP